MSKCGHGTLARLQEFQSAGRKGRLGRKWTALGGGSVTMSILLKPEFEPQYASMLTLVMGLSVSAEQCTRLGVGGVSIKWPNDVVVSHKNLRNLRQKWECRMERSKW